MARECARSEDGKGLGTAKAVDVPFVGDVLGDERMGIGGAAETLAVALSISMVKVGALLKAAPPRVRLVLAHAHVCARVLERDLEGLIIIRGVDVYDVYVVALIPCRCLCMRCVGLSLSLSLSLCS